MNFPTYKNILITGASSGIGEAIAHKFSCTDRCLFLVARSKERLDHVADDLRTRGAEVIPIVLDITTPNSHEILSRVVEDHGKHIDLLVNNAGFGSYGFLHEIPLETLMGMIDLNVKSLVRLTHHFLAGMVSRNQGAILNVSSAAGFQPVPFMSTYGATKAFVTSFSLALNAELQNTNVRVVALCPGRTRTNFQVVAGNRKIKIRSKAATAEDVAAVALRALERQSAMAIEGYSNKLMVHLQRFFPRKIVLFAAYKIFKPKSV